MEFVCGETFLAQYPLFARCETTEKIGPVSVGYDPDSGSDIGVQFASQRTGGGKQLNPNRNWIACGFSNPAETVQSRRRPSFVQSITVGKKMRFSFHEVPSDDRPNTELSLASLGNTFLNVAKEVSSFVLATFPEANYQHWNDDESTDGAQVVA
jgi:hypothetical protein